MTFDYAKSRTTAERLIKRFGQSATLTQTASSGPSYDPVQTTTDHECTLAVLSYNDSDIDGTLVQQGDKVVYLSAEGLSVVPTKDDRLKIGGEVHEIIYLMPLSPAGTVVFWKVQVRL